MNYSMSVDEEKVEALVHTSGLHYSDFDSKNGQPKPWQLMKMLESARFFSHHWPLDDSGRTFRDYAEEKVLMKTNWKYMYGRRMVMDTKYVYI
ncbi:uncharacterized protein LOC128545957 isoform X2 [Mercenaria mercenaria]|uniref:uncharacterized protein LOC128545957 isoform X2 n=1 Tax=Mercenaria mercenaria TaxID=6596 RepID=UPI00234E9553|nr:uncharacterized protein LOC128545957 isoform X2 [Mercenaria mercenaria]